MKNSNISTLDASNWTYQFEKKAIEGFDTDDIVDDVQKYSRENSLPTSNTSTAHTIIRQARAVLPF